MGESKNSDLKSSDSTPPELETLRTAVEGLLFPSETDAPLEVFFWPAEAAGPLTAQMLPELAGTADGVAVKKVKLETFFRPVTTAEEWHNDEEKAETARWGELVRTLKTTLKGVHVFRVGAVKVDVFLVGRVAGGYAGVKTRVVET